MAVQGWIQDPKTRQTKRFYRDEKSWSQDPMVFVDTGVPIPGQAPLLKTRVRLHKDVAKLWRDLLKVGWKPVQALGGADQDV